MNLWLCTAVPILGYDICDVFLHPGQWFLTDATDAAHADLRYRQAAGYGPEVKVLVLKVEAVLP